MARRPAVPPEPKHSDRTIEQMRQGIERIRRRIGDLKAFDPASIQKRWAPEVTALQNAIDEALTAAFGHGTIEYKRYKAATKLDNGPVLLSMGPPNPAQEAHQARQYLAQGKSAAIILLQQAITGLKEEIMAREDMAVVSGDPQEERQFHSSKVFVVHGHDEAALQTVARFLEQLELEAIVLREQPDQGRTIIEKFEACAREVGFAVVLLTPDDLGSVASAPDQTARARQNVIFELGYFAGKLGRGRACLLRKGNIEIPSDLYGVIYTEFDGADGWKINLVREMKAAGLAFDANRMWK